MMMSFSSVVHTHLSVCIFMFAHARERYIKNALSSWPTSETTSSSNPGAIGNPRFDREHYMVADAGS